MIPKYLFTPTISFTAPLPVHTAMAPKEESPDVSKKRLEKVAHEVTQAFQFADNAGNYYCPGNRE